MPGRIFWTGKAVSLRLAASLRYSLYAATVALLASGAGWLMVRYIFAAGRLPEGVAATAMRIHGAAAMATLVLTGSAIALHVPCAWRERRNRLAGLAFSVVLALVVLTGYLLYYVGSEAERAIASMGHWILGLAIPIAFACHASLGRRSLPADEAPP